MVFFNDIYQSYQAGNYDEMLEGIKNWMLKRETAFLHIDGVHPEDDKLQTPIWFGLGCWTYAFGGLVMMTRPRPKWTYRSRFCFETYALILIFIQSPLSFMADYMNMTNSSVWHIYDRFFACTMFVLTFALIYCTHTCVPKVQPLILLMDILALIYASACFICSQSAQVRLFTVYNRLRRNVFKGRFYLDLKSRKDKDGFIFYHHLWHMYPIIKTCIYLIDLYIFEGLSSSMDMSAKNEKKNNKPMGLSSCLMSASQTKYKKV